MEKIIFLGLVIPIFGFVLYLGATAIMNGFSAKSANKINENSDNEEIDSPLVDEDSLSYELEKLNKLLKDLGVDDNLIQHKGLTPGMLLTLGEKKIKTLKDFAELSSDELIGGYDEKKGVKFKIDGYLEEFALSKNEADDLIINARNIVFK